MAKQLILASQSPRRLQLLQQAGFTCSVRVAGTDETPRSGEAATDYVERVAREKAQAVWESLTLTEQQTSVVLAADTEVVLGERIFGKPLDAQDAVQMLHALSGKTHAVMTAVACQDAHGVEVVGQESRVQLHALDADWITDYVHSGEADGKAGAYGIQGFAATAIAHLDGSFSSVMGLPLFEATQLLARFQIVPQWRIR